MLLLFFINPAHLVYCQESSATVSASKSLDLLADTSKSLEVLEIFHLQIFFRAYSKAARYHLAIKFLFDYRSVLTVDKLVFLTCFL